ncbi:MAG: hypothetical protein FWD97_05810 [Defluviitaleaceae bacterium]|nr:hypothetical protein [Defluviitaleaceae bacterium]
MVGAGIARPSPIDDTVNPKSIVPTEKGRAMPAPTIYINFEKALANKTLDDV